MVNENGIIVLVYLDCGCCCDMITVYPNEIKSVIEDFRNGKEISSRFTVEDCGNSLSISWAGNHLGDYPVE